MNSPNKNPNESTEPTLIGESLAAIRDEIEHNAMFNHAVAQTIIAHQTAMAEQHDPQADPSVLAAAEEQARLTQATLEHLKNSQQSPETDN